MGMLQAWVASTLLAILDHFVRSHRMGKVMLEKIHEYFAAGVRLGWVVYCEPRQVYVYRSPTTIQVLTPQDTLEGDDVITGFTLPVAKLFEDLDEIEEPIGAQRPV